MTKISAITFDLWDTVIQDDSDEPERKRRGLRTKHDERRHLLWKAANDYQAISRDVVNKAYDETDAEFRIDWYDNCITWTVDVQIRRIFEKIGRKIPEDAFRKIVSATENMEIEIPPAPVQGIKNILESLSKQYPLGVISDTIVTPGRNLREWLRMFGMLDYFSGFAFSDEVGHSKPHRDMFLCAAKQLNVAPTEIVHVGDREKKDIDGAHALGMRAILFVGSRNTDANSTKADAVCEDYGEFIGILDRMNSKIH